MDCCSCTQRTSHYPSACPCGVGHAGSDLARLGAILSAGRAFWARMEPLGGKRNQDDRRKFGALLLRRADAQTVTFEDSLGKQIQGGFPQGDDAFDAVVGLFGMLQVCLGQRSPGESDERIIRWVEGWILDREYVLPGMCKHKLHPRPGGWLLNRGTKPAVGRATAAQRPQCTAHSRRPHFPRLSACARPATLYRSPGTTASRFSSSAS